MKYIIVGTAGHVDHGKTTLIQNLTGIDTDRLREEKERGISIELGFAPFVLPSGRLAGVVDVPGHERFIKHMVAGVGGIDLVLLIIAANEGVMPQTLEHLHILDLLGVEKGIIVITKADLVEEEWLSLVEEDVEEAVRGTVLNGSPIKTVSAYTGEGMDELKKTIDLMTAEVAGKDTSAYSRLPIDRVFTIKGSGTVVTGTLIAGKVQNKDIVEILPDKKKARVRQIQVHGKKVEEAQAGQRVAINLAGIETDEIARGDVLSAPNFMEPTQALDGKVRLVDVSYKKEQLKALQNRARIRFHTGTTETLGRVILLDRELLNPGETAFAQFFLEEPIVAARGDLFVLRSYSPVTTIGGGKIIEPFTKKRKRFKEDVLNELKVKDQGKSSELIEQFFLESESLIHYYGDLAEVMGITEKEVEEGIKALEKEGKIIYLDFDKQKIVLLREILDKHCRRSVDILTSFHRQHPLKAGLPQEEFRMRLFRNLSPKEFSEIMEYMEKEKIIRVENQKIKLPEFNITMSAQQKKLQKHIIQEHDRNPFSPPLVQGIAEQKNLSESEVKEVCEALVEMGALVKAADGHYFSKEAVKKAQKKIEEHFENNPSLTLAEFRDMLKTSRKYALPLLGYFDEQNVTKRIGDKRVFTGKK